MRAAIWVNDPSDSTKCGYLRGSDEGVLTFDTLVAAIEEIERRGIDHDTAVRAGRTTAYACWAPEPR